MKLTSIQLENVKKVKCVTLEPSESGLTVIGGNNAEGKTSILDAIAYAFGGEKYRPSNLKRQESLGDPIIHIETDDGLIIERRGKNSDLHVTDSTGKRAGQTLLDSVVGKLAIDLPKFINATPKDKAKQLLQILGVGAELSSLDNDYKAKFDTRLIVGRERDIKAKSAQDMPYHEDAPSEPLSISDLIKRQQDILARNGLRRVNQINLQKMKDDRARIEQQIVDLQHKADDLTNKIESAEYEDFELESTAELERQISEHEEINRKVSENAARREREQEAEDLKSNYEELTKQLQNIEKKRYEILSNADMPLEGLSISTDGELLLNGMSWDCMSGSQQLVVAASIAARVNPKCGFVLMDKMEQFDRRTLEEFGKWLEEKDLQAICTRVSTGDECTIIIQNGEAVENNNNNKIKEDY